MCIRTLPQFITRFATVQAVKTNIEDMENQIHSSSAIMSNGVVKANVDIWGF